MKSSILLGKIKDKSAIIGVIGLGYVGLPLALSYSEAGFKVIGFDIDPGKISSIESGDCYIRHIGSSRVVKATEKGLSVTTDYSRIKEADAVIICVPTPLNKHQTPDLSFIINTMGSILPYLKEGQVLSLESTTYPGTTDEELLPRLESRGFEVGKNYFLLFSPEREDPGNSKYNTKNIPKIVGGHTKNCLKVGIALYGAALEKIVPVSSTKTAEMTKLLENIHRAVNIGLVNEMKIVADKMGIDIYEVIDAAATKPFGFTAYYPGPGLGGHCIPIDPFYLTWKAREYGLHARFIELAGEINNSMPDYVISKLSLALNKARKSVYGSNVLIIGIAYKKNIDDCRESPSVEIMEKLKNLGANMSYHDNYFPSFPKMRKYHFEMKSEALTPETISKFDVVLVSTDHDYIDYNMLLEHSKLIVDARGRYRGYKGDKVVMG